MYSMVTILYYILKVVKEILNVLSTQKEMVII